MRKSSIIMLIAAVALGLVAVLLSRTVLNSNSVGAIAGNQGAVRTVPAVVAAADIGFGEKLLPEKLKVIDWPADKLPQGTFQRVDELVSGQGRAAMRPITANEILTTKSLSEGATRLSTAQLLNPSMRAVSVPVTETTGVAGMIYPGDRVDVYYSRQPEEALPYSELLAQGARVLAVGLDMNVGKDKPELVKSATIEVSPLQAQKVTLALATGQVNLALRHFTDETRVRLQTVQVTDLNDGTVTRLVRKPKSTGGDDDRPAAGGGGRPSVPAGPSVVVTRGTKKDGAVSTTESVLGK
jgi:pilus assembly protein CpaB